MRSLVLTVAVSFFACCVYCDFPSNAALYAQDEPQPPLPLPFPSPSPSPSGARVGGPELPGGGRISCDLPGKLHRQNTESKGLGLCVFTSIHHAATWQNVPQLVEFPKWIRDAGIPGGSTPRKTAACIAAMCKDRRVPEPDYIQVEDLDLTVLKLASKTGRMVCCTYGLSPSGRYGGQAIAHMVNCVHADDANWVVLDNNHPGYNQFEHMSAAEFLRAYRTVPDMRGRPRDNGRGWSFILLSPSAPPVPVH